MFTQVSLQEVFSGVPLFPLDLPTRIATLLTKDRGYETIWELSNRICDRYLPELSAG
jgi:hypothetical protein